MSAEKLLPEEYLDEIIDERSLTMEDGRGRGTTIKSEEDVEIVRELRGPDDGDNLG